MALQTGSTEFIDLTTADQFVPEIWHAHVISQREQALVFARNVDRRFEEGLRFGDTIHVGQIANLTTRTKSANTAITYETDTGSNIDISIATHKYAAIAVEDIAAVQTNHDQLALYAGKMGYALAEDVDDTLAGLPDDLNNFVGNLGVGMSYDEWVRSIQYLDDEKVPKSDRVAIISPAEQSNLLKEDKYVHNDYSMLHGSEAAATELERAYVTSFLRTPVYVTTNVEGSNAAGHDNVMFHKEAFALVMQMNPKMEHMRDIDYFADKVAVQNLYGTKLMRDDGTYGRYAVWMKGE